LASALIAVTMFAGIATAQSDTETVTIRISPYACTPGAAASLAASMSAGPHATLNYGQTSMGQFERIGFTVTVSNAGCGHWSVTAELTEFKNITTNADSFPASTLVIKRTTSVPNNPQRHSSQPAWVQALPSGLATGAPVMPSHLMTTPSGEITFSGPGTEAPATASHPLLSASSAEYGTPGNSTAYYDLFVKNLPANLTAGDYTADLKVTLQGGD